MNLMIAVIKWPGFHEIPRPISCFGVYSSRDHETIGGKRLGGEPLGCLQTWLSYSLSSHIVSHDGPSSSLCNKTMTDGWLERRVRGDGENESGVMGGVGGIKTLAGGMKYFKPIYAEPKSTDKKVPP